MPYQTNTVLSLLAALCLGNLPASAAAPRWYEVELMIVSQPPSASSGEQWPALPQLAYPASARFLVDTAKIASRREAHAGHSELDPWGRLWLTTAESAAPNEQDDPQEQVGLEPASPGDPEPVDTINKPATAQPELTPRPFTILPLSGGAFDGKTNYLQRRGGYRILFHQRWIQPVHSAGKAVPIVIDPSGDSGDWPALQGTIKIHIARFLHLDTNLWLNTQGEYLPSDSWRMPAPPLGPPSVIVEEQVETPSPSETATSQIISPAGTIPASAEDSSMDVQQTEEPEPVYPWRHAVLVKEERRMRSNEIHYLDHPLLGLVVTFTPLDAERLAELAAAHPDPEPSGLSPGPEA